jgi:hypothetical protein
MTFEITAGYIIKILLYSWWHRESGEIQTFNPLKKIGRSSTFPPQESRDVLVSSNFSWLLLGEYYVQHLINCPIANSWILT